MEEHPRPTSNFATESNRQTAQTSNSRELEDLQAAMMTVDNGFEDQWWHQGPKQTTADMATLAGDLALSASMRDSITAGPLPPGWTHEEPQSSTTSAGGMHGLVSPISEYNYPNTSRLNRSLTTRSDELFFPM
jgi:hypothetical protein